MELGQVGVLGPQTGAQQKTPSGGTSAEARRPTEAVKLRVPPDAKLRLEAGAERAGVTMSAYVVSLMDRPDRPAIASTSADPETLREAVAAVRRLAAVLGSIDESMRTTRNLVASSGGLVKHLFTLSPAEAEKRYAELSAAVAAFTAAAREGDAAFAAASKIAAELSPEIANTLSRLRRIGG